nr:conjugal transfer protein TraX [Lachnospiraceae bacterium]
MSGTALKCIAALSMLLDHVGAVLFPEVIWLRYVGRIAFPIYCFLIVEGFFHTRNLAKYMMRLLIFGLISEVPFDLAFHGTVIYTDYQNVFWTLLLGLFAISFMSLVTIKNSILRLLVQILIAVPFGVGAELMHTDYRWIGVAMISIMYLFRRMELIKVVG